MRFGSSSARTALSLALTASLPLVMAPLCWAQNNAPAGATTQATANEATITAIRGQEVTLGLGANDGAQRGAVYGITRDGKLRARLRVTDVRPTESTATIFGAEEDFVVAVGDTAQFIAVEPLPAQPVTPTTPTVPTTPTTPTIPSGNTTTTTPDNNNPAPLSTGATGTANAVLPTALISAVEGTAVTINAGSAQGVRTASTVPVLRDGNVTALVRIQTTTQNTSTGVVVWRDENGATLAIGDTVGILPGAGIPGAGTPMGTGTTGQTQTVDMTKGQGENQAIPAAPIRYETGASNAVVPRADRTYQYLASLASAKLITRYPADVFYSSGARYHRTEEDINFTRAQIADLIREALNSDDAQDPSPRTRAALQALTQGYANELRQLGVSADTLANFSGSTSTGFTLGYAGQNRASLVGGTTKGVIDPFSERQGGRRTKSGLDSQVNIFAQSGNKLNLFAQINSGTAIRNNTSFNAIGGEESGLTLRRALLSYNADRLLKGLTVDVGRNELWWGPGHFGTLLLSDVAGPLNQLHTTYRRGSIQLESLYSPLDRGPLGGKRSLYGHNLQIALGPQTRIGIAETLLVPTSSLDGVSFISAFTPFPLFTAERLRHRNTSASNGNALESIYMESSVARGFQGYGELLIDDIGVNSQNLERNRLGTLIGAHLFTPRDPEKLGAYVEYANLQGRTYLGLRALSNQDYYYHNRPLGYPVAPLEGAGLGGAESLRFEAYLRAAKRWRLSAGVELADLQSEQAISTGPRSRQQTYRLRAAYDLSQNLTLIARAQRVSTSQPTFVFGGPTIAQKLFQLEIAQSF